MSKVRIRLFKVPGVHEEKLLTTTRLLCRVYPKAPGHYPDYGHRQTLTLTEALAYLCSEVGRSISIHEVGVVDHCGPATGPYRTFEDGGASFEIVRTEDGFAIKDLHVGPAPGSQVRDYTDNPGAELVGRMKQEKVELEVDRPYNWNPHNPRR